MPRGPLRGLKVLDLSLHVAGPYCTRLLASLGADVLKVEPPSGDPTRRVGPFSVGSEHPERSPLFLFLNQGKQGVTLDLELASDRARLNDLVRVSDVLIESFHPRISQTLGLRYANLANLNERLVVTSVTPFGLDGPYRDHVAEEIVVSGLGGLLGLSGTPERPPLRPPGWQASYLGGTAAAVGTLLALHHRLRIGVGQQVDASQVEAVASVLEGVLTASRWGEPSPGRQGHRLRNGSFTMMLPCQDGHVVVSLGSEADWEAFSYFIGDERLRGSIFLNPEGRQQNAGLLEEIVVDYLKGKTRAEFFAQAQQWRFPCCAVLAPQELESDSQHRARRFLVPVQHPVAGRLRYPRPPFRLRTTRLALTRAPLLAEHNAVAFDRWLHRNPRSRRNSPALTSGNEIAAGRQPLSGVRVLDLTSMWAGPLCTRLLADAGAEVIKIELPARPDGTRRGVGARDREPVPTQDGGDSAFFAELNRNKLGVTIDLRQNLDRERFCRLVSESDLLVENFSPRVMANLGFDYLALQAINPRLVMMSMPAFGSSGPFRNGIAFGSGIEAMSGFATLAGYQDGPPMLQGVAYGDPAAGLHGAVAALAVMLAANSRGEHVELAQREALSQYFGEVLVALELGVPVPPRLGNRDLRVAPQGCFPSKAEDRWVAISINDEQQWARLCTVIGQPALASDKRFASTSGRWSHHDLLDDLIAAWTRTETHIDAARILQEAGVAAAAVLDPHELLLDPHLAQRGFVAEQSFGIPYHLSAFLKMPYRPAPRLGEHNGRFFSS